MKTIDKKSEMAFGIALSFFLLVMIGNYSCQEVSREEMGLDEDAVNLKSNDSGNSDFTDIYWGEEDFCRSKGKPTVVKKIIGGEDLNKFEACFMLIVKNGNGESFKTSSAVIKIDGKEIIGPSDFSQQVNEIENEICTLTMDSYIEVEVRGKPGSCLLICIKGQALDPTPGYPENLYLVGAHNGWDATTASPHLNFNDGTYEVYQNIKEGLGGYDFKWITELGSWEGVMGDDPDNPGHIIKEGETEVNAGGAGFYCIKADLGSMTWELKATTWGIIGDATPGGWDSQTDFTNFDPKTNTFTMDVELTPGKLKFRGTEDWTHNYGGSGLIGKPVFNGDSVGIAEAGSYTITFSLGHGGNYSYSIVKI